MRFDHRQISVFAAQRFTNGPRAAISNAIPTNGFESRYLLHASLVDPLKRNSRDRYVNDARANDGRLGPAPILKSMGFNGIADWKKKPARTHAQGHIRARPEICVGVNRYAR